MYILIKNMKIAYTNIKVLCMEFQYRIVLTEGGKCFCPKKQMSFHFKSDLDTSKSDQQSALAAVRTQNNELKVKKSNHRYWYLQHGDLSLRVGRIRCRTMQQTAMQVYIVSRFLSIRRRPGFFACYIHILN